MNRLFIAPIFALLGAAFLSRCEETLRAWLPQATTSVVPDASHAILQMNPRAVAERLHRS
jgi:hypothetical protein